MKVYDYNPEVRSLVERLEKAGCKDFEADNCEHRSKESENGREDLIGALTACDEAHLYCVGPKGEKLWLFLVLGNEPGVIACDYTGDSELLDRVTEEHYNEWENREQPIKEI